MYDDLVKKLRFCVGAITCNRCEWRENCYPGLPEKQAADSIENLDDICQHQADEIRELKNQWIPVTERLPETPGEYMVAYHPCYWDRVSDGIEVGLDSFRGKTSWAKKKYQRVTHWMPLPEPPKEE